jgi:hypothetical protein
MDVMATPAPLLLNGKDHELLCSLSATKKPALIIRWMDNNHIFQSTEQDVASNRTLCRRLGRIH